MDPKRIGALSLLCCEAAADLRCEVIGGYAPKIVKDGAFDLSGIKMEVDGKGIPTGKFRASRPAGVTRPVGDWPSHWADCIHEFDGHGLDAEGEDRKGESMFTAVSAHCTYNTGSSVRVTVCPVRAWTRRWCAKEEELRSTTL